MIISYLWLKDYIAVDAKPDELARLLAMAGIGIESVRPFGDDHLLELEITANRPDWLSYLGVAREVAALTGKKVSVPAVPTIVAAHEDALTVIVEDRAACPRYTARVIRNLTSAPSPAWLQKKIQAQGLRPVNAVVDITNFCLFETGEPLHAFDLDKIAGATVVVRRARKGETITTIDNVKRTLEPTDIVIADALRPIAIAGVMGGVDTEVTAATKHILLEAALFDPISVRRTARRLALSTDASYRFERKVDPGAVRASSDRASALVRELAGGRPGSFFDVGDGSAAGRTVRFTMARALALLGVTITEDDALRILHALGCAAERSADGTIVCLVPSFRQDIRADVDLIEEIARIYGYEKIPATLPPLVDQPERHPVAYQAAAVVTGVLNGLGFDEIMTYSLTSRTAIEASGTVCGDTVATIMNPLSAEQAYMRPDLLAGMLGALSWNVNRKADDLKLFELANVYRRTGPDVFAEELHLALAMTGAVAADWARGVRSAHFADLKGALETVLTALNAGAVRFTGSEDGRFSPATCAAIGKDGTPLGIAGALDQALLARFDIKTPVLYAEIRLDTFCVRAQTPRRFAGIPRYPSVVRDLSLLVGKETTHEAIVDAVREAGGALLAACRLVDRYAGKQIPDDKISLTYRLEYRDAERTLEEREVSAAHQQIIRLLDERFGAKLR